MSVYTAALSDVETAFGLLAVLVVLAGAGAATGDR